MGLNNANRGAFLFIAAVLLGLAPEVWASGRKPPWPEKSVSVAVNGEFVTNVRLTMIEDVPTLEIAHIRRLFGGRFSWKSASRRVLYRCEGRDAVFALDSSTAVVAGKPMPLEIPFRAWGSSAYVPVSFLATAEFQSLTATEVRWIPSRPSLTIDAAPEVSSPRFHTYPHNSKVMVEIGPRVHHRVLGKRSETLTVRFYNGRAREWEKLSVQDGAIASVELAPRSRTTDLIVTLATGTAVPEISLEESPRALVISVIGKAGVPQSAKRKTRPDTPGPADAEPAVDTPFLALTPLRTIVIDPGHGGKDPGAVGPGGTLEKDVNLQVATALADLLEREGRFRVLLTREDDRYLTLQERSSAANKAKADLFLSIHCNSGLRRESAGFEAYVLSENASDDEAAAAARRENSVLELEGVVGKTRETLEGFLWALARNEHMNESAEIAAHITRQVSRRLSLRAEQNRGVKHAGFYVLRGTSMPSVLIELGFLSHPREEGLLRSSRHQRKLVDAVYAGVLDYEKRKIEARLARGAAGGP